MCRNFHTFLTTSKTYGFPNFVRNAPIPRLYFTFDGSAKKRDFVKKIASGGNSSTLSKAIV